MKTVLLLLISILATNSWSCDASQYRAFDFWLGDWVVTTEDGNIAGHNSISAEENGCLIVERWRGAQGSTGQSYNYYDPAKEHWRQLWVSNGAIIEYSGHLDAGAMSLEGNITYQANKQTLPFRGRWTPQSDGSVRQELTQWNPETKTWDNWFTGIYRRP